MIASRSCRTPSPRPSRTRCCGSRCTRSANTSGCSRARRSTRWCESRPRSSKNTRTSWVEPRMSNDAQLRGYWREEFALTAILLVFFLGIVAFAFHIPFDARLFPLVIGGAGILLVLAVGIEQVRRRVADVPVAETDDAAARADWPRYCTALLAAPVFGLLF